MLMDILGGSKQLTGLKRYGKDKSLNREDVSHSLALHSYLSLTAFWCNHILYSALLSMQTVKDKIHSITQVKEERKLAKSEAYEHCKVMNFDFFIFILPARCHRDFKTHLWERRFFLSSLKKAKKNLLLAWCCVHKPFFYQPFIDLICQNHLYCSFFHANPWRLNALSMQVWEQGTFAESGACDISLKDMKAFFITATNFCRN